MAHSKKWIACLRPHTDTKLLHALDFPPPWGYGSQKMPADIVNWSKGCITRLERRRWRATLRALPCLHKFNFLYQSMFRDDKSDDSDSENSAPDIANVPRVCANVECSSGAAELKQCRGCRITYFCSTACQKKVWPAHRAMCKSSSLPYKEAGPD